MKKTFLALLFSLAIALPAFAQTPCPVGNCTQTQQVTGYYAVIPISNTLAVNNQVTLTIPAPPPNQYNYICTLGFQASQNGTATANSNLTVTSTNFKDQSGNNFALKYSLAATANLTYDVFRKFGEPSTGCAKSTSPATATTFVSPAATANTAFSLDATYYQAP